MKICIIVVLLLSSGAVSGGLGKVLRQEEFIVDIYQQFPHSCIFIKVSEAQQQGENQFYIVYMICMLLLNRNVLTETWIGSACVFLYITRNFFSKYIILMDGK
jgi:NADH:ubiquinone oxidoreductase subunit 3 (subunit A)